MDKLSHLIPGETISVVVRVLEEPEENKVNGKKKLKVRVGDGDNIANLVAWDQEADRLDILKGDVLEIIGGECPVSHKDTRHPPTLSVTKKTIVNKKQIRFPSIKECMQRKFLDQIPDYSYGIVTGFINQVYQTASYFCERCKKFSDEMCDCGNFPSPIFRITGAFSDGTRTVLFSTISERVAEKLTRTSRREAKRINPKSIMDRPYRLLGYLRNEKFWVEDVLK